MLRNYSHALFSFILLFIASFVVVSHAEATLSTGTIDPDGAGYSRAYILNDGGVNQNLSNAINTGVFTTQSARDVTVTDDELTGWMFGEITGWISLNCSNTSSCGTTDYKVENDGYGNLSGYAWGPQAGWINFAPTGAGTDTVKIGNGGDFTGYAWSQLFGYVSFNCSNDSSCGTTDFKTYTNYRPIPARPQCDNTLDDDGDGLVDYPNDGGCLSISDNDESGPFAPPPPPPPPPPPVDLLPPPCPSCTILPPPDDIDGDGSGDGTGDGDGTGGGDGTGSGTGGSGTGSGTGTGTGTGGSGTGTGSGSGTGTGTGSGTGSSGGSGSSGSGSGNTTTTSNFSLFKIPPILTLLIGQVQDSWIFTRSAIAEARADLAQVFNDPSVDVGVKIVTAAGIIFAGVAGAATAIFLNPVSFAELVFLPMRLWSLLLIAFGLKKRTRPWGTVYDSITKQPLDPAYVVLMDMNGNEVATSITDLDGRYGFLVAPGTYTLMAHKSNYDFPTGRLKGKNEDELYRDLYHGETVVITQVGQVITKNIPLDPLKFDWNEFVKKEQSLMKFHRRRDFILERLSVIMFVVGFAVASLALFVSPSKYNIGIFALYVLMAIVRKISPGARARGSMVYKDGNPISFGILRVFSAQTNREVVHKVADAEGNYYCLVPNGIYYVTIERKNPDESYQKVFTSEQIEVKKGIINRDFKVDPNIPITPPSDVSNMSTNPAPGDMMHGIGGQQF